jgi:hypothetical protein
MKLRDYMGRVGTETAENKRKMVFSFALFSWVIKPWEK